jgi:hypothetical protein
MTDSYQKRSTKRATKSKNSINNGYGGKNVYVDKNEKNLLNSLVKIKEFRANLDNPEFHERFLDQDRHNK